MEGQMCAKRAAQSSLAMHKNSKTISKIRIIHIFAPEIIKTDAENFRELVQRLTGKPSSDHEQKKCSKRSKSRFLPAMRAGFHAGGFRERRKEDEEEEGVRERIKEEEEIWRDANTGGGFLGGFAEFDDHFPFVEQGTVHDNMDVFEEPQVIN